MKNLIVCMTLILYSFSIPLFSMEKANEINYKVDDKACYKAIDSFKDRYKDEYDSYRYYDYADAVKSAVAFGQNMNRVSLSCELARMRTDVSVFPLFIVMAKENRCTVLLEIMLHRGADPNMCYAAQYKVARPLSEAITYKALDNARLLLQWKAKPIVELKLRSNDPDKDQRLSLLLEYGAKPQEIWAGPLTCDTSEPPVTQFSSISLN